MKADPQVNVQKGQDREVIPVVLIKVVSILIKRFVSDVYWNVAEKDRKK